MKFKTTKKAIMASCRKVIQVPYCKLQQLLNYKSPLTYTEGVYGWNADIYDIGYNAVIVTGYRPFGNYKPSAELVEEYKERAKIVHDCVEFSKIEEALENLIKQFLADVIREAEVKN